MRSRSVLVVLTLLAFTALPADAARNGRNAKRKAAAQKRAAAAKKQPAVTPSETPAGGGALGATRKAAAEPEADGGEATPKKAAVAAATAPKVTGKPRVRARTRTTQSRTGTSQINRQPADAPAFAAARSFDSSAAVAPRRKPGRIRRFFAGIAVVAVLGLGAVGWQSADMNSKLGDAWNFVQDRIEQVFDQGGGGNNPTPIPDPLPVPDPQPDPGPDPGQDPSPDPEPNPDPSPDPGQDPGEPSPNGGKGNPKPSPRPETP